MEENIMENKQDDTKQKVVSILDVFANYKPIDMNEIYWKVAEKRRKEEANK